MKQIKKTWDSVHVVILGAAAIDITVLVSRLPQPDEIVLAKSCQRYPGGSGGNVAVGLARLGHRVAFAGKVGADEEGSFLLKSFVEEGVNTDAVIIDPHRRTASCFIAIDEKGNRVIFALGGVAPLEKASELNVMMLQNCHLLYIGDTYIDVALAAAALARQGGVPVIFSPGGLLVSLGISALKPLLSIVDVLILSQREAEMLIPDIPLTQRLSNLKQHGPQIIIETRGSEGVALMVKGQYSKVPAWRPERICDTTGAGDAFSAGLMHGYLTGYSWYEAAKIGCATAAIKIAHFGARNGLPNSSELQEFITHHSSYQQ